MSSLLACCRRCVSDPRCWVVSGAVFVWFVAYPEDLRSLLLPAKEILSLTKEISVGLYVLVGGALAGWGVYRTFRRAT